MEFLALSGPDIYSLIKGKDDRKAVVDAVEVAYKALGTGQLVQPQKQYIWMDPPDNKNFLVSLPSYVKPLNAVGIKWGGLYFNRVDPNIPADDIIILNDPANGTVKAILDGTPITILRTGGGHAIVAARYLAHLMLKTPFIFPLLF